MQYDMGLAKKLILKKASVPTVYSPNVNMTPAPPVKGPTICAPVRPVFEKERHTWFIQRHKLIQISEP